MNFKTNDEVWTADNQMLGTIFALYHRPTGEVNPKELLYASYLAVENETYGDNYFVPADFIAGRDELSGHIVLQVTMKVVRERTWTRKPAFVAHGQGMAETLA